MRPSDADIPKALQGDLTLVVIDLGGYRIQVRHSLEDAGVNNPQFQAVPVSLRLYGISEQMADRITALLDAFPEDALPPRADIPRRALAQRI